MWHIVSHKKKEKIMKPLNKFFDHTLLKPEATAEQITALCNEAKEYDFYSVCVNSCYTALASKLLFGTDVKVAVVVGFPLGASTTETKVFETNQCCINGASEIDMVLNIGKLKDRDFDFVKNDIKAVVETAAQHDAIVKVILETCLLSDEEIVMACELSKASGASFVKTSTGFNSGGATAKHVRLMKDTVGSDMLVKASGGIRDYKTVLEMIDAGADRIGASASVDIMKTALEK